MRKDAKPINVSPAINAPQQLPPAALGTRARLAQGVFSDKNLNQLAHLLDDCFVLPGTQIRFGVDGIVGLVPFAGDVLGGLLSSLIVVAAWFRGAPPVLLARMVANLAIDVGIGMVPVLGDAFDIAWKANRRNYALLSRHLAEPQRHRWRDWGFLLLLIAALITIFAVPLVVLGYLLALLVHHR